MKNFTKSLLVVFLMTTSVLMLKAEEVEKVISKEYKVSKGAMLKLSNKHGSIYCENWSQEKVSIEVSVKVEHNSKSEAAKLLDKIEISMSGDDKLVTCITEFKSFKCNKCQFEVEYIVKMPDWINVDISMKYGDLFIDEIKGNAKVGIGFGNLRVNNLSNEENEVYVSHSNDCLIENMKNGKLKVQHSELEIESANILEVNSSHSEMEFGKVYSLDMESQHDDLSIDELYSLSCKSEFSDIEIGKITKRLIFKSNYGDLEVDHVSKDFEVIDVVSKYSDVELGIDRAASYTLNVELEYSDIDYPEDFARIKNVDISRNKSKIEGFIGEDKNSPSKVIIKSKHGDIEL